MHRLALVPIESILINDEDLKLKPYLDSKGNWTYGIGRYIGLDLRDLEISTATAMQMLREDIDKAYETMSRIFTATRVESWSSARRDTVACLIFNMGEGDESHGFKSFHKMIAAISNNLWSDAANELRNSLWALQVDPRKRTDIGRDDRMISMLQTGEYHASYNVTG